MQPAQRVDDLAAARAGEPERHGVHREISPAQVLLDRCAGLNRGQRAGALVAFPARRGEVERVAPRTHGSGAEAREEADLAAEPLRHGRGERVDPTLDGEVDIAQRQAGGTVAHRPADDPQRLAGSLRGIRGGVEQAARAIGQEATDAREARTYKLLICS